MIPPPHLLLNSALSLNCALKFPASLSKSGLSSWRTDVSAMQDAFFLCTSCPRRDFPLIMQYGISFFRHSAGIQHTSSIGSTSCAITTNLACFCSPPCCSQMLFVTSLANCSPLVFGTRTPVCGRSCSLKDRRTLARSHRCSSRDCSPASSSLPTQEPFGRDH